MNFAKTREEALSRLREFSQTASRYSRLRNHVVAGHDHVSCLSAAIRHRLVTEWEVAAGPLEKYAVSTVEKFTQEVYWRTYWKGWLSLRPQVWQEYLAGIREHPKAEAVRSGEGPIAVMNGFARELVETGYLHNHARMWFAAYWVHVAHLPWQLGAKFFQDHLLDFDPASNTLSWRWVAGLQTPGKTYLPRRSNIEKYVEAELLDSKGLELLENPVAVLPEKMTRPEVTRASLPEVDRPREGMVLWVHEEDLHPESSPLSDYRPSKIVVTGQMAGRSRLQRAWLESALVDTVGRVSEHYQVRAERAEDLGGWLAKNEGAEVVGLRPEVGPLHDRVDQITGAELHLLVRPEDRFLRSFAKAGFFGFWKKLQVKIAAGEFPFEMDELF